MSQPNRFPSDKPPSSPLSDNEPTIEVDSSSDERGKLVRQDPSQTETRLTTTQGGGALVFDQPVILRPSPLMPQLVIWTIVAVTSFCVSWACIAKVDEAVPAQGKLEPKGAVKEVKAPVGGVVKSIEVTEGEAVTTGEVLIRFDQTTTQVQEESLEKIRATLVAENRFYRSQLGLKAPAETVPAVPLPAPLTVIPTDPFSEAVNTATQAANLVQVAQRQAEWAEVAWQWQRAAQLMAAVADSHPQHSLAQAKTQEYRNNSIQAQQRAQKLAEVEITRSALALQLPPELISLTQNRAALIAENQYYRAQVSGDTSGLNPGQQERLQAAQSEYDSRVAAAGLRIEQLQKQLSQVEVQIGNNRDVLKINQDILNKLEPLYQEGGIAEVQFRKQEEEVNNQEAERDRLVEEKARLELAIAEAQEELTNTQADSTDKLLTSSADNDKRIAEIDSQLSKVILENEKQIQEIDSQISQARQTLIYQELRAPVQGTVFDLKPTSPGFVANTVDPILKIVPTEEGLVARVYITNQDIGFVKVNDPVDVRIDSFPYSEFGDVKGTLVKIGSDALPPNDIYPFYRFPAEVKLEQEFLIINGKQVNLQSGMSVSVNVKTRKRRVITFLTDLFVRKIDTLRTAH
jgi:HlyD family secretion protein